MPKISVKGEPIFHALGLTVNNSLLAAIIPIFLGLIIGLYYKKQINSRKKGSFFYLLHYFFKTVYGLFQPILGDKTDAVFPLVGGLFFYILFQNWFGLLPGVGSILIKVKEEGELVFVPLLRSTNADLNTTLALALIAVASIQFYGIKFLGFGQYIKKFINLSNPINFFLGILEIMSELSKVLSFAFRLFGNVFAGEVLLTIIAFLIPVLASFPFLMLELFVGLIQALIFSMLTTVFISIAVSHH